MQGAELTLTTSGQSNLKLKSPKRNNESELLEYWDTLGSETV